MATARDSRTTPGGPEPPPGGGILWSLQGELRSVLALPAAMAMQVAHPGVGAGVDQHSVFRTDPWGRGERSLRSMQLWVYGGERAAAEGRRLRELHRAVRGVDADGRPYRALDPACYLWVHASGYPVYLHAQRVLGRRPFTRAEELELYAEWLRIGRVLGIDDRDVPRTAEDFWPYYRGVLAHDLEATPVARELTAPDGSLPPPDVGPRPLRLALRAAWPLLLPPFARFRSFLTVGLIPPEARRAIGLPWSAAQERRLRRFGRAVSLLVPFLPERLRYLPLAREARREARRRGARPRQGPRLGSVSGSHRRGRCPSHGSPSTTSAAPRPRPHPRP
ncbi:oxygenase MpaB family protein [Streptomyces sp. ME19-01-6]|uniref:oxygenase MpaB family protein n=1 Tax=Streptomyces sp. ME19-01-6 TaxID=3028686 RepID=UPI0029B99B44|nr:oxygenase MpaB family protein [Streptomyces sp. ME19-01-6]MDX3232430.1 oxygenase MpaB family protein [Streptomyces sp. ME19-01-6]